jgi:hypothetical protein
MKRGGLKMVFCGAESGSTDTLARMNKEARPRQLTLDLARRMKGYGIVPSSRLSLATLPIRRRLQHAEFIRSINASIRRPRSSSTSTLPSRRPSARRVRVRIPGHNLSIASNFRNSSTTGSRIAGRFSPRRDPRTPWSPSGVRRRVRNFETVLNAYYPTVTDMRMTRVRWAVLRTAAAWRYHLRAGGQPFELDLPQVFHYQRPETTGFRRSMLPRASRVDDPHANGRQFIRRPLTTR